MPTFTTPTSHRSRATLLDIANSHARCRVLTDTTREVFKMLADGWEPNLTAAATIDTLNDAFFEAAGSCATRAAQSPGRRSMMSDLGALRASVLAGEAIGPSTYVLQVIVESRDARAVDNFERALRAFRHDGVTVLQVEGV